MSNSEQKFQTSRALRTMFNRNYDAWAEKHNRGLSDLAELCGVTTAYLSQVARYGRVPSRPVLILLAFNFDLTDPAELFQAAELTDPWPYNRGVTLQKRASKNNLLELRFDEDNFKSLIREVVQQELRPRSLKQMTQGRPIRIGLNLNQSFLIQKENQNYRGFFHELLSQLSLFLQHRIDLIEVSYLDCFDMLQRGELDLYGPIYLTPQRLDQALYSQTILEQGLAALMRKSNFNNIPKLAEPKDLKDIITKGYTIAVMEGTAASHFVQNHCPQNPIIKCSTHQECVERITLSVERQAHLIICDAGIAEKNAKEDPDGLLSLKFSWPDKWLGTLGTNLAIRPDWRELKTLIDNALDFLSDEGLLKQLYSNNFDSRAQNFVKLPAQN